jgi:hypothetical protein
MFNVIEGFDVTQYLVNYNEARNVSYFKKIVECDTIIIIIIYRCIFTC